MEPVGANLGHDGMGLPREGGGQLVEEGAPPELEERLGRADLGVEETGEEGEIGGRARIGLECRDRRGAGTTRKISEARTSWSSIPACLPIRRG